MEVKSNSQPAEALEQTDNSSAARGVTRALSLNIVLEIVL